MVTNNGTMRVVPIYRKTVVMVNMDKVETLMGFQGVLFRVMA